MLEKGSIVEGKYRILSELGRGGMSIVYLAINDKANKTWAIKEVRKDGVNDFQTVKQSLVTEIDTLKALNHPKLPSIVDVSEADDNIIIVMDYVEGNSLDEVLKESGAQKEEDVINWAIQLCDVLEYLHNQTPPIIYRDLKPSNIMLKPNGDIMIIDFGTAKTYEVDVGATTGLGTAGFAAPEQYINSGLGRTDARTDIYTLGMTMYSLLTNINPQLTLVSDTSVRSLNPSFSVGIDYIIRKCTNRRPEDRYQRSAEVMYDLNHIDEINAPYRRKQRAKLASFSASVVLTVALAGFGYGFSAAASSQAYNDYNNLINEAKLSNDYNEKIMLYTKAIAVPNNLRLSEAFLGLTDAYKEDSFFSQGEARELEKLIKSNKEKLRENPDDYVNICFETGKLFWYYYDSVGDKTNVDGAKKSVEWFKEVLNIENSSEYENYGMARVYSDIGIFYRDIMTDITEASDKGKYRKLFDNFKELVETIGTDENENEIVRLELLEKTRGVLHEYATKFKMDNVSKEEMDILCEKVQTILYSIAVPDDKEDVRTAKKNLIESQMEETKQAISTAYSTRKENDNEY